MISVQLTIAEIVSIIRTNPSDDLTARLTKALEMATYERVSVTISGFSEDRGIIPSIKVLRAQFGWGLKDAKDFCDNIRGSLTYGPDGYMRNDGKPARVSVPARDLDNFVAGLRAAGARVYTAVSDSVITEVTA